MLYYFIKETTDLIGDFTHAITWFLPRIVVCLNVLPLFVQALAGNAFLRNAVAVGLAFLPASHYVYAVDAGDRGMAELIFYALSEASIGFLLALTIALPYYAFITLGAYVDAWRGATFAALIDPSSGQDSLVTEKLMQYTFTLLLISTPALMLIMQSLYDSFLLIPPGTIGSGHLKGWIDAFITLFSRAMTLAFLLSAPVFIALMLVEAALGIISVYTPNMQVYSLAAGIKSLLALLMLFLMFEFLSDDIMSTVNLHFKYLAKLIAGETQKILE